MTVPPGDEDLDQDEIAGDDAGGGGDGGGDADGDDQEDLAAEWETMVGGGDDGEGGATQVVSSVSARETNRVLNQDEIDSLLGFDEDISDVSDKSGIQAIINSSLVSHDRLPMLEVVFDSLVRMLSTLFVIAVMLFLSCVQDP